MLKCMDTHLHISALAHSLHESIRIRNDLSWVLHDDCQMSSPLLENIEHAAYCGLWTRINGSLNLTKLFLRKLSQGLWMLIINLETNQGFYNQHSNDKSPVFTIVDRNATVSLVLDQFNRIAINH